MLRQVVLSHFANSIILFFSEVNCWPSENNKNGCDVNIEYELQQEDMELQDVVITIPLM